MLNLNLGCLEKLRELIDCIMPCLDHGSPGTNGNYGNYGNYGDYGNYGNYENYQYDPNCSPGAGYSPDVAGQYGYGQQENQYCANCGNYHEGAYQQQQPAYGGYGHGGYDASGYCQNGYDANAYPSGYGGYSNEAYNGYSQGYSQGYSGENYCGGLENLLANMGGYFGQGNGYQQAYGLNNYPAGNQANYC